MMKPSLQVRLSQHLALTPQLQQSIRLLQLSTLELHQEIEQMLEQNPFLDVDDDSPAPGYGLERVNSPQAGAEGPAELPAQGPGDPSDERSNVLDAASGSSTEAGEPEALSESDFGAAERTDWDNGTERDDFDGIRELPSRGTGAASDDDHDPVDSADAGVSLAQHLREQTAGMRLQPQDWAALQVLIDSLNADGWLADPLEDIAEQLAGADTGLEERQELFEHLRSALGLLQSLDPPGVGARGLSECLLLQLRAPLGGDAADPAPALARQICAHHLELLARRDTKKLMLLTGADEPLLRQAQAMIRACEPKPGRPFARTEVHVVVPDVIVQKAGRGWRVVLNGDVMPKLRLNEIYAQAVRSQRGSGLSARLQEARWFMKNIQQRFDTIQRVSQAIIERQKGFFSHGEIAMKPLVLREIADELGLHESTISRVTTAKYMQTPFGTFELKYFFGSSLNTEAGGNASSTAVRALIRQLVANEDTAKPLSDSQLSDMLGEQGIQVARRTVAKYREALKIAPTHLRKAL